MLGLHLCQCRFNSSHISDEVDFQITNATSCGIAKCILLCNPLLKRWCWRWYWDRWCCWSCCGKPVCSYDPNVCVSPTRLPDEIPQGGNGDSITLVVTMTKRAHQENGLIICLPYIYAVAART